MAATSTKSKLGAAAAKAAVKPATQVTNTKAQLGQLGAAVGQTMGAGGQMVDMYKDPVTGEFVDENGLLLAPGYGDTSGKPISPHAQSAHVARNDDTLLTDEYINRADIIEKRDAAIRAGRDPHVELTPAEQKAIGVNYSDNFILPGISYISGDENAYIDDQKGSPLGTAAGKVGPPIPGSNALGAPVTPAMAGKPGGAAAGAAGGGGTNDWIAQLLTQAQQNQQQNVGYVDSTLNPAQQKASAAGDAAVAGRFNNVGTAAGVAGAYGGINQQILDQQRANASKYNANDAMALGNYGTALDNANNFNAGNYGQLQSAYGNYSQLAPSASSQWQGDLTSQAASAQADPQAIAAQYQALGQLQSAASGGLNTTSQAAQAYADPQAVALQMRGINDLYGASKGSLDVQLNPEIWARQNEALDQYDAWRTPELTDQERFMKELARTDQEQQEKSSRDAMLRSQADKGFGGQIDLAGMQQQSQQNSTNRMLRDLGANANAVSRAERSLAGYAQQGSDMQGQYLANEHGNKQVQLQALGMYTDASGQLRSQTFDEAYKRGLAGDQTAMANADRMLQAAGMSADTAGNIRQQSFNEDYSRGMAADNMSQYNRSTSLAASQWSDTYRADQQNAAWGRDTDMYQAGRQYSTDYTTNEANRLGATQNTNATAYGRDKDSTAAWSQINNNNLGALNGVIDRSDNAWTASANNAQNQFGNQLGVTGMGLSARQTGQAGIQQATQQQAAQQASNAAIAAINGSKPQDQSLLGGLFGGIKWV